MHDELADKGSMLVCGGMNILECDIRSTLVFWCHDLEASGPPAENILGGPTWPA